MLRCSCFLLRVVMREPHRAALDDRHAAAALRLGDAHRVAQRAPLAGEIRDRHARRPALVDAPHAVPGLHDREERRAGVAHVAPYDCLSFFGASTRSWFLTDFTPSTFFAISPAFFFASAESTLPLSVTTPSFESTSMWVMVFKPASEASAVFTLVVRVALAAVLLTLSRFFARSSAVGSLLSALSTSLCTFSRFWARSCAFGSLESSFGVWAWAGSAKAAAIATAISDFIMSLAPLGLKKSGIRRRRGMDHLGLVDRRAPDLLLEARPRALGERLERDRLAAGRRAIQRADHAHVGQAFVAAGLGRAVLQHAVGQVKQLGRELVALGEAPLARLAVEREAVLERARVVVRRLDRQVAFGAREAVLRNLGGAERRGEARQALVRKAQHRAHRFLHLVQRAGGRGAHLERLVGEQRARRVDAVDTDVVEHAAARLAPHADVARRHRGAERGVEQARFADAPGARDLARLEVGALEVQAVADHQLDAGLARGVDHALAFFLGHRHRLLDQH